VEEIATPIHERAQTTNINKSSSNIQQAVKGTATLIHERAQTTNINKNSSNTQQPFATPSHERAQSVKERYKDLRLPDSSNTQPPSAAPSHEQVQSVKERYKNLQLPVRYQTNESTRDDDDASTENQRLSQEVSDLPRLREDNKFFAGVNAEFSSENDDLKEEVNELKTKLEQYQIRSSSESLDVIDVPEERLAKRFKSDG
ncbi:2698_t:CDS:2, partial [Rhizophagus irregularis]